MGWCSGTPIFDAVARNVLDSELPVERQFDIMRTLAAAMYDEDWDCESDSRYYKHPVIQRVMRDLNPKWYEEADDAHPTD